VKGNHALPVEAFGVDFAEGFHAGRADGEPPTLRHRLESAEVGAIAEGLGLDCLDLLPVSSFTWTWASGNDSIRPVITDAT